MAGTSEAVKLGNGHQNFKPFETSTGIKFVSAGLAASFAELVTLPIDTSKVRLQVSSNLRDNKVQILKR